MKKFTFKFQTLLQVRKLRENEFLRQVSRTQRAHQDELNKKSQLVLQLEKSLDRRAILGQESEGISSFHLEDCFIIGTKQRIVQADRSILRASKAMDRAIQIYGVAKRQTEVIETLLNNAKLEYRRALKRKDEKNLDELIIMRNGLTREAYEIDSNEESS
jgi:flagellar export protein FliJ